MRLLKFKRETLKKSLCLVIILINSYIIFDNVINPKYEKSSKIDNFIKIKNSNSNATQFEDIVYGDEVTWGNSIAFSLNFTYTEDNGTTWDPVLDPNAYCNITISDPSLTTELIKANMTPLDNGIFFKAINSTNLSAGGHSKIYLCIIEGYCPLYPDPNPFYSWLIIKAVPTGLSMHNYSTFQKLTTNEISQYYGDLINVTFKYYNNNTNNSLTAESITYLWDYGSGPVNIDPRNSDYYTLEINTSTSPHIGIYLFQISAALENYTTLNHFFILRILIRPTTLNGEVGLVYLSSKLWAQEAYNFTFIYRDAASNDSIGDLTSASYEWQELNSYGDVIPGRNGTGNLIQSINNSYILDFETSRRSIGNYVLIVTLDKLNYEYKLAIIDLEILPIPMSVNGTPSNITISKEIEYQQANNFTFEINNTLTYSRIGDLDQAFYYWYRLDSNGTILEGPSEKIDLIKDLNNLYILDFNTELKSVGFYRIHVEFHKENYTSRSAIINLTIIDPTIPTLLMINIITPKPDDEFGKIAPDFELEIIGTYDTIWYTIDNGKTNITISSLSGNIEQIEWDKLRNGGIVIYFYANNSNRFVVFALVPVIKSVSSPKVYGYDLIMIVSGIVIAIVIKKKLSE